MNVLILDDEKEIANSKLGVRKTFGNVQLLNSIIMTGVFIVVIYGGYFIITYLCSQNIIKEK